MKIVNGLRACVFVLAAAWALPAHAQSLCFNTDLSGEYSFRITGQILTGPLAGFDNGVALVSFDGNGNLTSKDHVVINGVPPALDWRPSSGTYSVNPDCTGNAQVNFTGGRPPIVYYFILTNNRQQLDVVVANSGANVSVVATKR